MNFFEIGFLCLALIYGLFLIVFLAVIIYRTIIENKTNTNLKKELKQFAFEIESYLAYHNDYDTLTKKEILIMVCEILEEKYNIKTKEI